MLLDSIDWTNVLVALIAGLPAIISAVGVIYVHRLIRTPSGTPIGRQVESAHHVAIANHYRLEALGTDVTPNAMRSAHAVEAQVPDIAASEVKGNRS